MLGVPIPGLSAGGTVLRPGFCAQSFPAELSFVLPSMSLLTARDHTFEFSVSLLLQRMDQNQAEPGGIELLASVILPHISSCIGDNCLLNIF